VTDRPALSIVLPTRDRPEMLARCLDTVVAAAGPDDEVVVVDSASSDAVAVATVAARYGARLVRCERKGETVARNAGWRAARHPHVAYVDDDVWVDAGWADAFARSLASHPEAAFLTGRIEVPAHQVGTSRPVSIKSGDEAHVIDAATGGVLGHAASLAVRTEALEAVGGFDEELGAGCRFPGAPELDLFDRLFAAGRTGRYEPSALAWHDQWRARNDLVRLDFGYGQGGGARLAKLARSDRRRARRIAREVLWAHGVRTVVHNLRVRWEYGAAMQAAAVAGVVLGFARAIRLPVVDGHLRPRARA
jgi:glycosyltransferase involved in cell wall biosynthesis